MRFRVHRRDARGQRSAPPEALYYPFHLCHDETLAKLLRRFAVVHFRDFMALRLTPLTGMTAHADRMGDGFPELLAAGRLIQGYDVSGSLSPDLVAAIDPDLADPRWRSIFHNALRTDRRFQRGLFGIRQPFRDPDDRLRTIPFDVDRLPLLCTDVETDPQEAEYILALIKTAAALVHTYRLALLHGLQAATDSPVHWELFERTRLRSRIELGNHLIVRKGY